MAWSRPYRVLPVVLALLLGACGEDVARPDAAHVEAARAEIAAFVPRTARALPAQDAAAVLRRVEARIRPAAQEICREAGATSCRWDVTYDPSPSFNAYAAGQSAIVLQGGVMAAARNEAELAMVLAHEKAHHILDHVAETNRNAGIGAVLADLVVTFGLGAIAEAVGLPLPEAVVAGVRRGAAGAGAHAGMLAFSVANEKEADALAARILHRAGFDPRDARGMLLAMGALGKGDATPSLLRTHPAGPERLAHWDAVSRSLGPSAQAM